RLKHYSLRTEQAYLYWIRRYIRAYLPRHPRDLDGAAVEAFLTRLATRDHVAASTQMEDCSAESALESFTRQMKKLPAFLRESPTYDRGSEMARHEELARRLNIDIWFADPYAPWQRGSNENTNGLLRQFMPKGTDLSGLSQTQLNDIARLLNGRPRQTLGWRTPEQALAEEIQLFRNRVALDS
ncbi:IS30 family transposase, partial [Pseudoxanthomonas sp. J35]|uniref:IS30 family transposase n=1 Tax=Pseudoxanthomonas sp. J35 TaxID=935852 RepID=UPI001E3E741B